MGVGRPKLQMHGWVGWGVIVEMWYPLLDLFNNYCCLEHVRSPPPLYICLALPAFSTSSDSIITTIQPDIRLGALLTLNLGT